MNTITLDKLKRINQLGDRARHLKSIIALADSADELGETLTAMGFHLWEYNCQGPDIYKDGEHAYAGAGVCRLFLKWVRCDSMLHLVDEIDVSTGVIHCRDTSRAYTDAVEVIPYQVRDMLVNAKWQNRAKLNK